MSLFDSDSIRSRITTLTDSIPTNSSIIDFLTTRSDTKSNSIRLLCWLSRLNLIQLPATKFFDSLDSLVTSYQSLLTKYPTEGADCLVPAKERETILSDVHRGSASLSRFAEDLHIEPDPKVASEHCQRILILLSCSDRSFAYIQGFDRYARICYLLSLQFSMSIGIPETFAEASGFALAKALIQIANPMDWLPSGEKIVERFDRMDVEIEKRYPAMSRALKEGQHSAVHFGVRWELLMFADEHSLNGVFQIWDQIIANAERGQEYIRALSLAHVGARAPEKGDLVVCALQASTGWDVSEIIVKANEIFNEIPHQIGRTKVVGYVVIAAVLVVSAVYLARQYLGKKAREEGIKKH
jgi:hypothetical protein